MLTREELEKRAAMELPKWRDDPNLYQQIRKARMALGRWVDKSECQAALIRRQTQEGMKQV